MGCDIHLYAQKRIKQPWYKSWLGYSYQWISIDRYSRNEDFDNFEGEQEFIIKREDRIYTGGRNYNLFCALCGVRRFEFTGDPPIISEPKGLPPKLCSVIQNEVDRYGSDGHSHSWNSLAELEAFDWTPYGETCSKFVNEVLPKLKLHSSSPEDVMIVYFFDN